MSALIEFDEVCKYYQMGDTTVKAADHITMKIEKGEFVAIVGQSGSGKSTCMNIIGCLDVPTYGTYRLNGRDVGKMNRNELAAVRNEMLGFIFQQYNLLPRLNLMENVEVPLVYAGISRAERHIRAREVLEQVGLGDKLKNRPNQLSGGQQQRVAIARAIVNEPEVLLLDEPLAALDLKMRKDMQMELKEMHKSLGITFVYVTHDQEEALTLSDTIVVMSEGKIQQIGTPIDIYNEPVNSFVADFIGESNILNGTMIKDRQVSFAGHEFECVDEGFGEQMPVDVVLRPEDIYIFEPSEAAMLTGTVTSSIFKGVHYEMMVQTPNGYEFMVQDYHCFEAGSEVGLLIKPFDIHVMKKERICNTFEGKLIDATHVEFLGCTFECKEVTDIEPNTPVKVEIDFKDVILEDNEEDGRLTGEVKFILYKGNHYHLTVFTDWDEDIFVDTNDVWDDGDRVGITIAPETIRIVQSTKKEGSDK